MASPSGRAVRAVRAIQAPPPAPMPAHQEHYDTEPDSDQGHHLEEDGNETEGYDMMMDMPDQQGLPTPIANAAAPNEGAAPAVVATPPPNPAPPAQGEAAEEDLGMRVLQLESQVSVASTTRHCRPCTDHTSTFPFSSRRPCSLSLVRNVRSPTATQPSAAAAAKRASCRAPPPDVTGRPDAPRGGTCTPDLPACGWRRADVAPSCLLN